MPQRKAADIRKLNPKTMVDQGFSTHDATHARAAAQGLRVLDPKAESFEERSERMAAARLPYAPMRAHMEMAAMVLASGGTFRLAATHAGISVRQVKKYYSTAEFRQRILELRETMMGKIRGRIVRDLVRRTDP